MSKGVKIGISVMAIVIILMVIYYAFFSTPSDPAADAIAKLGPANAGRDPYYSAETLADIKDNAYPKYKTLSKDGVNRFWQALKNIYSDEGVNKIVANNVRKDMAILGWFKGMDLDANPDYLFYYKADIERYIDSNAAKDANNIKQGSFIK